MLLKSSFLQILFYLFITFYIASCVSNGTSSTASDSNEGNVDLESYSFDNIVEYYDSEELSDDEKYFRFTGEGELPTEIDGHQVALLRDSLEKMAQVTFSNEGTASVRLDKEWKEASLTLDTLQTCSYSSNNIIVSLLTPRAIVWEDYSVIYFCGAAHPIYSTSYLNYSRTDKKILTLDDLMKKDYQAALTKILLNKLRQIESYLLEPLNSISIPSQFCITPQGLRFTYGIYSILPYAFGEYSIDLNANDLHYILSEQGYELIYGSPLRP